MYLAIVILLTQPPVAEQAGWVDLFNGKNYAGFTFYIAVGPEYTFDVKDGCLWIKANHAGYTYTRQKYRNYELKYDWKFVRPENLATDDDFKGNSGVFLHIGRILKEWPQSVEVEGRYPDMGKLVHYGKTQGEYQDYPAARQKAMRKVGDWNTTHVTSQEGKITVRINGQLVAEGTTDRREGFIGFQAQGAEILYRQIRLKEIK